MPPQALEISPARPDEYAIGPTEVMIEQFGNRPPSVVFRRDRWSTRGRPYGGEQR